MYIKSYLKVSWIPFPLMSHQPNRMTLPLSGWKEIEYFWPPDIGTIFQSRYLPAPLTGRLTRLRPSIVRDKTVFVTDAFLCI